MPGKTKRWSDIDWGNERFTVTSSKTEHHDGHESRLVPIFPELLPYLRESFEKAEPGAEFCIARYRAVGVNLRTQFQRIIKCAGLETWPKLWQNLRSTRETELADQFPAHVASAWIGNSVAVAVKHYLQVTENHFKQAAQNAAQQPYETTRNDTKNDEDAGTAEDVASNDFEGLRIETSHCEEQDDVSNGRYRTRTTLINTEKNDKSQSGGAESGAQRALNGLIHPDLQHLNEVWLTLPQAIRAGILAMVEAAKDEGQDHGTTR